MNSETYRCKICMLRFAISPRNLSICTNCYMIELRNRKALYRAEAIPTTFPVLDDTMNGVVSIEKKPNPITVWLRGMEKV